MIALAVAAPDTKAPRAVWLAIVVEAAAPPTEGHAVEKSEPALGGFDSRRFTRPSLAMDAPPAGPVVANEPENAVVLLYPSPVVELVAELYKAD